MAWFVSIGFTADVVMRIVSLVVFAATPIAVVALTTVHFTLRSSWRAQTIELVQRASGVRLTPHEAGRFLAAVQEITTHYRPRDVREPPPDIEIPLIMHPGTTLRLEYRGAQPHYAALVVTAG